MTNTMHVTYYSRRTKSLNHNHAKTFDDALRYMMNETYRLEMIAPDLAYVRNASNRIVCELRMCEYRNDERAFFFRNERQQQPDLNVNGKSYVR